MPCDFIVETGAGLPDSNSYLSLAAANLYWECHGNPDDWTSADINATGALVLGILPSDGDTFKIGSKTYTFQTTLTNVDGNIEIASANLAQTQTNAYNAVNVTPGTAGVGYAQSMMKHELVTMSTFDTTTNRATVTAVIGGEAGNDILLDETFTSPSNYWDGYAGLRSVAAAISSQNGVLVNQTNASNDATAADMTLVTGADIGVEEDQYYFGSLERFNTITLNIDSAATDGTIEWEYYTGAGWADLDNVVDGTNSFQNTGSALTVTWDMPLTLPGEFPPVVWSTTTVNGQGPYYFVRARVSVTGTSNATGTQAWLSGIFLGGGAEGVDQKETALRLATQYLDTEFQLRWWGTRSNQTQALDWPRIGVDQDGPFIYGFGFTYPSTEIPQDLLDATAEAALRFVQGKTLIPDTTTDAPIIRKRVKVGPLEQDITYGASGQSPDVVGFTIVCKLVAALVRPPGFIMRG